MISSFADSGTRDIYSGEDTKEARKTLPKALWDIARRKLDAIHWARDIADLRIPPSNMLKPLKGKLKGLWSIRINDQFRIIFAWRPGEASKVQIIDYH